MQLASRLIINGAFPQLAGMRFEWSPDIEGGALLGRITSMEVRDSSTNQWMPFDSQATYTIATSGFIRQGGDEYGMFPTNGFDFKDGLISTEDLLVHFIRSKKTLHASDYSIPRATLAQDHAAKRLLMRCPDGEILDGNRCRRCAPGTYMSGSQCRPCLDGFYNDQFGRSSCMECPAFAKTYIDSATNLTQCRCEKGFFGDNGGACAACSPGGSCIGGPIITNQMGYARSPTSMSVFYACHPPGACLVANASTALTPCIANHAGVNCGACIAGTARAKTGFCKRNVVVVVVWEY